MSRLTVLPLLGLAGIVAFGASRTGRQPSPEAFPDVYEIGPPSQRSAEARPAVPPPPPPAPRLRSAVEAEEAEKAALADSAAARRDSVGRDSAGPGLVPLRTGYVPAGEDAAPALGQ